MDRDPTLARWSILAAKYGRLRREILRTIPAQPDLNRPLDARAVAVRLTPEQRAISEDLYRIWQDADPEMRLAIRHLTGAPDLCEMP
jgi:hypothetical protein